MFGIRSKVGGMPKPLCLALAQKLVNMQKHFKFGISSKVGKIANTFKVWHRLKSW